MSDVKMPEPVAWWNPLKDTASTDPVHRHNDSFTSLITTEQAEAYARAVRDEALEILSQQAKSLYEAALKNRENREDAEDVDERLAIDLWNVESIGMAKAYTNMQKAIRALKEQS